MRLAIIIIVIAVLVTFYLIVPAGVASATCGYEINKPNTTFSGVVVEGFNCGYHTNSGGVNTELLGLDVGNCTFYFITNITEHHLKNQTPSNGYDYNTTIINPARIGDEITMKGTLTGDICVYDFNEYYLIDNAMKYDNS